MLYDITFIKGKNLITKSIDDTVVTGWFECGIDLYLELHKQINKPLSIIIQDDSGLELELNVSINTETKNYIGFYDNHGVVKLDIILGNILLMGYLVSHKLFLKI